MQKRDKRRLKKWSSLSISSSKIHAFTFNVALPCKGAFRGKEEKQKQLIKTLNLSHMETLRKSLDKAVNIAARNNIPPMKGRTLILCAYGLEMTEIDGTK